MNQFSRIISSKLEARTSARTRTHQRQQSEKNASKHGGFWRVQKGRGTSDVESNSIPVADHPSPLIYLTLHNDSGHILSGNARRQFASAGYRRSITVRPYKPHITQDARTRSAQLFEGIRVSEYHDTGTSLRSTRNRNEIGWASETCMGLVIILTG